MFIKESSRRRKDGSQVTYLQLVVSQWDARRKTSRQRVLHNLGRKDQLDQPALQRLANSLTRYLDPQAPSDASDSPKPIKSSPGRPVRQIRPLGTAWLLHRLFTDQGWAKACAPDLDEASGTENAIFTLVVARALGLTQGCVPSLDTASLPQQAWTPPSTPQQRAQTLPATRSPASSLHRWPGHTPSGLLFVHPQITIFPPEHGQDSLHHLTIATDLQGSLAAHCVHNPNTQALHDFLDAAPHQILTLNPHQTWDTLDLSRAHHHQIWRLAPDAHPDLEALTKGRGRYRKINQHLSFRQSLFTQQGRRYRAFLVRTPDQPHILLTDQHQTEPEDLILGASHHTPTLNLLRSLLQTPRRTPNTQPERLTDLWLDLCACAFRLQIQRHTSLDWDTLLDRTEGLYALQHEGAPSNTWTTTKPTRGLLDLYSALNIPLPTAEALTTQL